MGEIPRIRHGLIIISAMLLKQFRFTERNFPLALLTVSVLSFGLFIPWLGFYWDDWPVILMSKFFGVSAYQGFYVYDRPFSAWTYILSAPLLGANPIPWQLFTLTLRWLTILFFWMSLRTIWPNRPRQVAWVAILILVYPVFTLQHISVAFSQHWICALLYAFSLWAMLKSLTGKRWWGVLGLAASALHLWTMEYFLGMEIFRYFVLWLATERGASTRLRFAAMLKYAAPYLFVLLFYVFWRLFLLQIPGGDPNPARFLADLRSQPLTGLFTLTQIILRDLVYMLLQVWANILEPARIELGSRFFLVALIGAVLIGMILFVFMRRDPRNTRQPDENWFGEAALLGLAGILLGALPGWLTYRQALTQPYGNRIALPALLGLGLLLIAILDGFLRRDWQKRLALSVLVGVAVFSHFFTANTYREFWETQKTFYWQLAWRVPALAPGTAILSDSEVVPAAGSYSTAAAINLMYADSLDLSDFPYWFFNMSQAFTPQLENLKAGKNLRHSFRTWAFRGDSENILLVDYDGSSCLHLISPDQPLQAELSPLLTAALPRVNPQQIITNTEAPPVSDIFGHEPAHGWCYYYQKASLAHQAGDWSLVIQLKNQASEQNLQPVNAAEWLVFVDAFTHQGDLKAAESLTEQILARDSRVLPILCQYWKNQPAGSEILANLSCQ